MKTQEHLTCFKNAYECLNYRAPLLVYGIVLAIYTPIANFIMSTIFGVLTLPINHYEHISETKTIITTTQDQAPFSIQLMVYDLELALGVIIMLVLMFAAKLMYEEIKRIPITIKECQCKYKK